MKTTHKLFATFYACATVSHASTLIDVADIHGSSNIAEITYADATFSVKDTSGIIHYVPQTSIKTLQHMPTAAVHAVLNSHAAWLQVSEHAPGMRVAFAIEAHFRLRGGRPINAGNTKSYESPSGSSGGDTLSPALPDMQTLLDRVAQLERQVESNPASNKCKKPEDSTSIAITACKTTYAATGGAIGSKAGPRGTIIGTVIGEGIGHVVCDPKGTAQSVKEGVKAGVRAFDAHIQQSARANNTTSHGPSTTRATATPGSYICKDGKCSGSFDYTADFSRSSEPGSSICRDGKCSGSFEAVLAAYERSEAGNSTGTPSGGDTSSGDSGDSCCVM